MSVDTRKTWMSKSAIPVHEFGDKYSEGSQLLAAELEKRDWSQGDLQRKLGVASGLIGRWLHGEKRPGAVWASKIEEAVGIPASAWGREPRKRSAPKRTGTTG